VNPSTIQKNEHNPRLIFRGDELAALEESIRAQGILVPLTVFRDGARKYTLLDGERRWRCAIRLGLHQVPVIIQPKPDPVTNIMMMFAIHNARKDWDQLPAALKLEELEEMMAEAKGSAPTEAQLAATASISVGQVRRYRKILALPKRFRRMLLEELEKPRSEQRVSVDHVVEASDGANRMATAGIMPRAEASALVQTVVTKFRSGVIQSTVEPRKLSRIARAVERGEVSLPLVRREIQRFHSNPDYSIENVFQNTVEEADYAHGTEQLVRRSLSRLREIQNREFELSDELRSALEAMLREIRALLGR
jgi:ParB family chromosome partitioning protein